MDTNGMQRRASWKHMVCPHECFYIPRGNPAGYSALTFSFFSRATFGLLPVCRKLSWCNVLPHIRNFEQEYSNVCAGHGNCSSVDEYCERYYHRCRGKPCLYSSRYAEWRQREEGIARESSKRSWPSAGDCDGIATDGRGILLSSRDFWDTVSTSFSTSGSVTRKVLEKKYKPSFSFYIHLLIFLRFFTIVACRCLPESAVKLTGASEKYFGRHLYIPSALMCHFGKNSSFFSKYWHPSIRLNTSSSELW